MLFQSETNKSDTKTAGVFVLLEFFHGFENFPRNQMTKSEVIFERILIRAMKIEPKSFLAFLVSVEVFSS